MPDTGHDWIMQRRLETSLTPAAARSWSDACARVAAEGVAALLERFPHLPRQLGAAPFGIGLHEEEAAPGDLARADLAAWRRCDAAAWLLLRQAGAAPDLLVDLYLHGDLEERLMTLRALTLLPVSVATVRLLEEAQRSNMEPHFRAAVLDSNLPARAAGHPEFGPPGFNRLILKAAFLGLPPERLLDATSRANPELSRMLADLATEREAAGRAVWSGTDLFIAHAPTAGTLARVIGGIEHGDDLRRRFAAEGLLVLNRPELRAFAAERLDREPRPEIRALLERVLEG